jgi:hypothetical protein
MNIWKSRLCIIPQSQKFQIIDNMPDIFSYNKLIESEIKIQSNQYFFKKEKLTLNFIYQ